MKLFLLTLCMTGKNIYSFVFPEQQLRDLVKPLYYTRMRLGEFDPPNMNPYNKIDMSVVQSRKNQELAITAAIKSFVLLKNENNTLPITETYNKAAVSKVF